MFFRGVIYTAANERERERERERIISQREREIKENVKIFTNVFPALFSILSMAENVSYCWRNIKCKIANYKKGEKSLREAGRKIYRKGRGGKN